jgi:hypothetical protein
MTRLLVSVRSASEALLALEAGADLIDVKEPKRGSLGRADLSTIVEVLRAVGGRLPVSCALGELVDFFHPNVRLPGEVLYAKFGLAACADRDDWITRLEAARQGLPDGTSLVAVAYADSSAAKSPDPAMVLSAAEQLSCPAILLDTWSKTSGSLLDCMTSSALAWFVNAARQRGLMAVIAGGLGDREIKCVLATRPDYVAVRGAACRAGRESDLDAGRVRALSRLVHQTA